MKVSVLIISRKIQNAEDVLLKLKSFARSIAFEILIGIGDNPSQQRNYLAKKAKGEWLLFLDDDSIPDSNIFKAYNECLLRNPEMLIAGGPSVYIEEKTLLNKLSVSFFTSPFGIGPFRSRYLPVGEMRLSNERELILSNLMIKRSFFLERGGFNKELYPNEENQFIKRNQNNNIFYLPSALVFRKARSTFLAFLHQMFKYGEGRAKHLHIEKDLSDILFFLPSTLAAYLILLPLLFSNISAVATLPLVVHFVLSLITSIKQKKLSLVEALFILPSFNLAAHFSYGVGLILGVIKYFIIMKIIPRQRELSFFELHQVKAFE